MPESTAMRDDLIRALWGGMTGEALTSHPFDKDGLDCCRVCGEGIEDQTPGLHGETPSPAQVIADALNAEFDIWLTADFVTSDILAALVRAGYVIVPREALRTVLNYYESGDTSRNATADSALDLVLGALAGATPRKDG